MLYLAITSFLILAAYIICVCRRIHRIPASISDTYYLIKHGALFTITLDVVIFLLLPVFIEVGEPGYKWPAFLACAGLGFVANAPAFKSGMDRKVHISATVVCALFAQLFVYLHQPWLLITWILPVAWILYKVWGNYVMNDNMLYFSSAKPAHHIPLTQGANPLFWIEVTAFANTYATIFIRVLTT